MIVVFPMLCSSSLNYNILPGVGKVLERYLIVHELDRILEQTKKSAGTARVAKGRIQIKEDDNSHLEINNDQFISLSEQDIGPGTKPGYEGGGGGKRNYDEEKLKSEIEKNEKQKEYYQQQIENLKQKMKESTSEQQKEKLRAEIDKLQADKEKTEQQIEYYKQQVEKAKQEKEKAEKQKEKELQTAITGVTMNTQTSSIEPTYMEIDRIVQGEKVRDLIGVKVIPFKVNSTGDQELVNMMLYDQNLSKLDSFLVGMGRSIKRKMYDMYKEAIKRVPVVGGRGTITGNIRHDVIMAKTSFRQNIFLCVNKMELEDEFFQNAGGVKKLFKLGWPSIIALDDAAKVGTFCMETYKGVCYNVPYNYMFRLLGKSESNIYDDISSVKKSSAGLFRKKTNIKKLVGESVANNRLNEFNSNYMNMLTDDVIDNYILNEIDSGKKAGWEYIKKIRNLAKILTSGNAKKITNEFKGTERLSKLKQKGKKINPEFDKCFSISKNSIKGVVPEINDYLAEVFSTLVATLSIRDTENPVKFCKKLAGQATIDVQKKLNKIKQQKALTKKDTDKVVGGVTFAVMVSLGLAVSAGIIYGLVTGTMAFTSSATTATTGIGYEVSVVGTLYDIVEGSLQLSWNIVAASWNTVATAVAPLEKLLGPLWTKEGMEKFFSNPFWIFRPQGTLPGYSFSDIFAR